MSSMPPSSLDDLPGRLLYLDVLRNPAVIPLCRDLATLLECFVELAEAGHVIVGGHAPILGDPADGRIGAILRRHGVAERPFGTAAP